MLLSNVPLHDKNWFQTGGLARFYCEPKTLDDWKQAILHTQKHQIPLFVFGQGANILISDEGFDGLAIRPIGKNIEICISPILQYTDDKQKSSHSAYVKADAGVILHDLIEWCLNNNILGLEEFSGIPGTVGGSVYINLHYYQFLLEHFLIEAEVLDVENQTIMTVPCSWFNFGYNTSKLHKKKHILISATFALKHATPFECMYARGRRTEIIRHRTARYPSTHTCGSFFSNFDTNEVSIISNGKKMIYVAYYLDKLGIKGELSVGDAIVSYQHANMIVNRGNATSNDIVSLARIMQEKVYEEFGLIPHPECQLIGFKDYPLHTNMHLPSIYSQKSLSSKL